MTAPDHAGEIWVHPDDPLQRLVARAVDVDPWGQSVATYDSGVTREYPPVDGEIAWVRIS